MIVIWSAAVALVRPAAERDSDHPQLGRVPVKLPPTSPRVPLLERLKNAAIATSVSILLMMLTLAAREVTADAVTIEVFAVSEGLQKSGFDGRSLALRFIDRVSEISAKSETQLPRRAFAAEWQRQDLDLTIPQLQTNLRAVVAAIRRAVGVPQITFTCSLAELPAGTVEISARVVGYEPFLATYERTQSGPRPC